MNVAGPRRFIYSPQIPLIGRPDVTGYGTAELWVDAIDRDVANDVIRRNHYSRKVYSASTLHFGVFYRGELAGVLQYGFAMNPASAPSVVAGTGMHEYLELNRMWLSDDCPRNSESMSIGYTIRAIRKIRPAVAWIQSFADERCGGLGVVYQACSFLYCGEHLATFWELDGVVYHNSLMTRDPSLSRAAAVLQAGKGRAVAHSLRQFRYIRFLRAGFRDRLLLDVHPYPKRQTTDLDAPAFMEAAA